MAGATSTVSAPANEQAATSTPTAAYRPHLDGLRAVAVYLVVLFHAGVRRFTGGFIGVDVFFVLSGYLVTQLLLRDLARTGRSGSAASTPAGSGGCSRPRSSRCIVTAVVFTAIASPAEVADARRRVQGRVPVRRELVLHPPVERLLRRRHRRRTRCCSSGRSRSRSSSTWCGR